MPNKPDDLLQEWMRLVNEGDVPGLAKMYDEKAVLIPTFSNRILSTPEGIRDYFEKLGAREDLSIALHEKTVVEQALGGAAYSLCGIYCWRFTVDSELLNFEARFTYVVDLDAQHPILHHHSSQIPRTL